MKKLFLLLIFVYGVSFGQTYPKDAVELLVGKDLKVLPASSSVYFDFYKNKDFDNIKGSGYYKRMKVKYELFNGAIFKLISFERYKNSISKPNIKLELFNEKIGTVFYDYDPNFKLSWIFEVVGGLEYPNSYWCKDIETKEDKFTSTIKYNSPITNHVFFIKEKGITYIYLKSYGKTIVLNQKGIIILLSDGSKIENKTTKIDVDSDGDGYYTYSTLFALTDNEIKKLSENYITDYRLYIYDFKLDEGVLYQEYLKCLSKM